MSSGDHVEQIEIAKLDSDARIRASLHTALEMVCAALDDARTSYGRTVRGASVNEPLIDLYRECGTAEAAVRNALNAHEVLVGRAAAATGPPSLTRRP